MLSQTPYRNTIFVESAEVLTQQAFEGGQFVLRLQAPKCARNALPGQFAHLQCDPALPMRRPLSIMRVCAESGWVEFLYKETGEGTRLLKLRQPGERISLMGPIGRPFEVHSDRPRALLLGGGVGIPPMLCLAESMLKQEGVRPLVLMGSEVPFPFEHHTNDEVLSGIDPTVNRVVPLLQDWKIPSRLASLQAYPGVYQGYITDLARQRLAAMSAAERDEVEIFACGPHPMLQATARLAAEFNLPCQVSLEEYMACAVGGCAGCVVKVTTADGVAMKRVCVDGPVFEAQQVFTAA